MKLMATRGLKLKLSKYEFVKASVSLLGHIMSSKGAEVDSAKIFIIQNFARATKKTEVRNFLGIAGYYWRFINSFATISEHLHAVTLPKKKFTWSEEMENAFEQLKKATVEPPESGVSKLSSALHCRDRRITEGTRGSSCTNVGGLKSKSHSIRQLDLDRN